MSEIGSFLLDGYIFLVWSSPNQKNKLILSLKVLNSNTLPHSDDIAKIEDIRAYEMRF